MCAARGQSKPTDADAVMALDDPLAGAATLLHTAWQAVTQLRRWYRVRESILECVLAQQNGNAREQTAHQVQHQHRLALTQAQIEQAMVEVLAIGLKR